MLSLDPCRSHLSLICVDDSDAPRRSERVGRQAIVEVMAINRPGLLAAMCGPLAEEQFTIQTITASCLNTVRGDSVAYLGAHLRIGDTTNSDRPEAMKRAYEAMREKLASLSTKRAPSIPAKDRLRFGLTMRDGHDTYGILDPVTKALKKVDVDISWMAGAARPSLELGQVVFAAEMKLDIDRKEAPRVIRDLQVIFDGMEKQNRSGLRINLHGLGDILV